VAAGYVAATMLASGGHGADHADGHGAGHGPADAHHEGDGHPKDDGHDHKHDGPKDAKTEKQAAAESRAPLFGAWPEQKPSAVLVLTGEMHGYLRPCGCSEGQMGGLARRGGFLKYLRDEKKWNAVPLDLGDLIKGGGLAVPESDRYHAALESLKGLGYPVVGVGAKDLYATLTNLVGEAANVEPTKLIAANLQASEKDMQELLAGIIGPFQILTVDGVKIGVAHVLAPADGDALPDASVAALDPQPAAAKALEAMTTAGVDLKVLLAYLPVAAADELIAKTPGYDLVVCRSEREDALATDAKWTGGALRTWVGEKGKSVGVVGFWKSVPRGDESRLLFDVVPMDPRFDESEEMNVIYARFVASLKAGNYVEKYPKTEHRTKDQYVGSAKCAECHKKAFAKWSTTGHAHAMDTLVSKAKPAGQQHNPDCVLCHVTGYEHTSGFQSIEKTPFLGGNQCENCHGPGKAHSEDKDNFQLIQRMRLDASSVEGRKKVERQICQKCHDTDNSPKFDFDAYWPKVAHPGRD
ncbi:MAG: multiheme c-type cytochrome, partial [Planctomycetia bacterium]